MTAETHLTPTKKGEPSLVVHVHVCKKEHGSRFTTDFAFSTAWMVKGGLSKKKVAELMRVD